MRVRQGPASGGVIEHAIGPDDHVVAAFAGGGELGGDVVHRRLGAVVVGLVTRHAGGGGDVVVAPRIDDRAGAGDLQVAE